MTTPRRRHLWLPRRPSFEASGRLLLVALAADRPDGHPDNCSATGRILGVSRETVRRWRDSAIADGLLIIAAGRLTLGSSWPTWCDRARAEFAARGALWSWDPVPRRFLRGRSPDLIHAAALVYRDTCGDGKRRWIRSDAERAAAAGSSRATVAAARAALVAAGMVQVRRHRRGRASLVSCAMAEGSKARHGSPMSDGRAERLQRSAERGRRRRRPVRRCHTGEHRRCNMGEHPPLVPQGNGTPSGPLAPVAAVASPVARAGVDGRIVPIGLHGRQQQKENPADRLRALLADDRRVRAFVAGGGSGEHRARELLAAAGVFDSSRRRLEGWPKMLAQRWGTAAPAMVLGVLADVAAARGRSAPRSFGAVVASRLPRLLAGRPTDALSAPRRGMTLAQLLVEARR